MKITCRAYISNVHMIITLGKIDYKPVYDFN